MKTSFLTLLLLPLLGSPTAIAAEWELDPAHANVGFSVQHMMVSNVRGEFTGVKGSAIYDPAKLAETRIDVEIDAKTINTKNGQRDEHLKGADFFDVQKYPVLKFVAQKIRSVGKGKYQIPGMLTMHGVTQPVVLDVTSLSPEVKDPWGNQRIGVSAQTTINRKDFGLSWNKTLEAGGLLVGEKVQIQLDLELIKKKPADKT